MCWNCSIVTWPVNFFINESGAVGEAAAPAIGTGEREKRGVPVAGVVNLYIAYIHIVIERF